MGRSRKAPQGAFLLTIILNSVIIKIMPKSQYQNFEEYAQKDPQYLVRVLKNQLHKTQSKIEFKDGTTYHVTKSGSRYWQQGNYMHRETGPASSYESWQGGTSDHYYLFSVSFASAEEHRLAVDRLNFLREQTSGQLESLVNAIAQNIQWEDRQQLWKSILQGSTDSTAMLESLQKLSEQYQTLTNMSRKFIQDFS